MTMIRTESLGFAYRNDKVLHDISLDFAPGKITALLGPNGSGKSTLLKCCAGILKGYDGNIFIDQQPLYRLSPRRRARYIAYVPQQETHTFPVSVLDTILMGRKPYIGWMPSRNDYAVVETIMHQLHLDDIAQRPLDELSGGQRQRVIIARAGAAATGFAARRAYRQPRPAAPARSDDDPSKACARWNHHRNSCSRPEPGGRPVPAFWYAA